MVLARAGLARIGRLDEVTEVLDPMQMLPAPGQGALAVECRAEDTDLADAISPHLEDPLTRAAVTAERAVLATLEARVLGSGRVRWPRWSRGTTETKSGCGRWRSHPTGRCRDPPIGHRRRSPTPQA